VKKDTLQIRIATINDIQSITKIYNEAIIKTTATFDTQTKTIDEQIQWFKNHGPDNPILVAEKSLNIVGFAALSLWSDRCAYSKTAEISLYVLEKYQRKGIGKRLMKAIIKEGEKTSIHVIIARITEGNNTSINLHKSFGFEHIGTMKEVGDKFGNRLDVHLMQKIYRN